MEEVSEGELRSSSGAETEDGAGGEVGNSREGRQRAKRGEHGVDLGRVDGGARPEENEMLNSGGGRHGGDGGGGGEAERGGSGAYGLGFDEVELGPESD
jgi:hypothetical protein